MGSGYLETESMETELNRLVLGTAQLGMNYGISNLSGQPDLKTTTFIIETALDCGIRSFDTAQAYGNSEEVLGSALRSLKVSKDISITTKLHPDLDFSDRKAIVQSVEKSLEKLGVQCLDGLMLHSEKKLTLWREGLGEALSEIKSNGLASHIGVSVYSPEMAEHAVQCEGLNLIQYPANVLDHRFDKFAFSRKSAGLKLQVRSIYLQGLLLMNPDELPENMKFAAESLRRFIVLSASQGISQKSAAFLYVRSKHKRSDVLFGAENSHQVKENVDLFSREISGQLSEFLDTAFCEAFENLNENIVRPDRWPR